MLFKNLSFFHLNKIEDLNINILLQNIQTESFKPIFGSTFSSEGFCQLNDFTDKLLIQIDNTFRIKLQKQEKILPPTVINNQLKDRIALIENEQKRYVSTKEKKDIKDDLIFELLPQAFSKISYTDIILDINNKFLLINEVSKNKVDNILTKLRKSIASIDIGLVKTKYNLSDIMTSWFLNGQCSGNFYIDDICELQSCDYNNFSNIKINKQNLHANEIVSLAKNNKKVTKLGLIWGDKISFIIDENFFIKKIKFLDISKENINYNDKEQLQNLFLSNHVLMVKNFSLLLNELILQFGGLL